MNRNFWGNQFEFHYSGLNWCGVNSILMCSSDCICQNFLINQSICWIYFASSLVLTAYSILLFTCYLYDYPNHVWFTGVSSLAPLFSSFTSVSSTSVLSCYMLALPNQFYSLFHWLHTIPPPSAAILVSPSSNPW